MDSKDLKKELGKNARRMWLKMEKVIDMSDLLDESLKERKKTEFSLRFTIAKIQTVEQSILKVEALSKMKKHKSYLDYQIKR